ncbi:MAG TPA: TonB-dependent receptor, partial [Gemmatimonadales bacterium]|nr:TonB-dependent receptor [Gemmatimonadales bacterium]
MPARSVSRVRGIHAAGAVLVAMFGAARLDAQASRLTGRVTDPDGAAVAGATVSLRGTVLRAATGSQGRYTISNVPAGHYTVMARAIGFAPGETEVTIAAGETVTLDLTLTRAPIELAPINVVVGSRARHTAAEELAVPVDVFTADQIAQQGTTETSQILQALAPSVNFPRQSVTDATDIARPFTLRGLSPDHTLVLINGWRRHQTAVLNTFAYGMGAGSSGVDLNSIPSGAIERIEVLRDGASAQYGSDAIAGVVNIITRTDFDGFQLETNQGGFDEGDGYSQDYSVAFGAQGERGRAFFTAAYTRQDAVFAPDRELSREVVFGAGPGVGGSSGTPQGRFIFLDPRGDVDGDGEPDVVDITLDTGAVNDATRTAIYDPNNPTGGDFHAFGTLDRFNFRPYNYLVTPNRRVNLFGKA